jgi:AcrR family transcriptional regulator
MATRQVGDETLSPRAYDLVRSAYQVIARQGSHRLSLQDVADEAGVSKGMVLYYFKSKEHLFLVTMRWALERTAARVRRRVAGAAGPGELIDALVDAVFVGPEQDRDFSLLYLDLIEHTARVPSFEPLAGMANEIVNGLYEEVVRDGVAAGGLRVEDPVAAAAAMRALIDGTFLTWLQRDDWRAAHPEFKALCHRSLRTLLGAGR